MNGLAQYVRKPSIHSRRRVLGFRAQGLHGRDQDIAEDLHPNDAMFFFVLVFRLLRSLQQVERK